MFNHWSCLFVCPIWNSPWSSTDHFDVRYLVLCPTSVAVRISANHFQAQSCSFCLSFVLRHLLAQIAEVWFCSARVSFFSTMLSHLLGRTLLKWLILCQTVKS